MMVCQPINGQHMIQPSESITMDWSKVSNILFHGMGLRVLSLCCRNEQYTNYLNQEMFTDLWGHKVYWNDPESSWSSMRKINLIFLRY